MSQSCIVIVGDIGGTNARLQLLWYCQNEETAIPSIVNVTRQTYRTNTFAGLHAILKRFLDDTQNEKTDSGDVLNALNAKKYEPRISQIVNLFLLFVYLVFV